MILKLIERFSYIFYLQNIRMGSSQTKDKDLDIYMELQHPHYVAGSMVNGIVYINAKAHRSYEKLTIRLEGEEHVYWTESAGEEEQVYQNRCKNYDSIFTVFDFRGVVGAGHYSFPFSFLLPLAMSGSYHQSDECYIHYTLTATLSHPLKPKQCQFYGVSLNIQQPVRSQLGPIQRQKTTEASCCGCCFNYGNVVMKLACDRNLLRNGQTIVIRGQIDNKSTTDINTTKISLIERRVMIASDMSVNVNVDHQYLFSRVATTKSHRSEVFQIRATVPESIVSYTAIGRLTARYFVIRAQTDMGCCMCCSGTPFVEMHVVVQNTHPKVMVNKNMPAPPNWNPQKMPPVSCMSMNPFIYQSYPGIEYTNQLNSVSPMMPHLNMKIAQYPPTQPYQQQSEEKVNPYGLYEQ